MGKNSNEDLNKFLKINRHNAEPAQALMLKERRTQYSHNPKPSLHDRFNSKFYIPSKYLNPYGSPHSTFAEKVVSTKRDVTDRVYTNPEGLKKLNNMEFKIKTERVAEQFKTTQVLRTRSERNNKLVNKSVN